MSLNFALRSGLCWGISQLSRPHAAVPPAVVLPSLRAWHAQRHQAATSCTSGRGIREVTQRATALQQPVSSAPDHDQPPPPAAARHHAHGRIELVLGPMFAGKTSELLRRVERYEAAGLRVAIVKSNKDTRYSAAHVVTHDGVQKPCFAVPTLAAFREAAGAGYAAFHVIAVDEAQFFTDLLEFCAAAADGDAKTLVLAGLDGDFQRQRFGQVLDLVPMADCVTKLTATCTYCKEEAGNGSGEGVASPAVFSLRIAGDASLQEVVGGADKYAPVCRRHYVQLSKPPA